MDMCHVDREESFDAFGLNNLSLPSFIKIAEVLGSYTYRNIT
jgi:hypothetical protein